MQLRHLKEERCRDCGAESVGIEISGKHTNGQQFETRSYACGHKIRWVPNFSAEEEASLCPNSKKAKSQEAQRDVVKKKIRDFIESLEGQAPQEFMDAIKRDLQWTVYRN